jgi:hypothetical protein
MDYSQSNSVFMPGLTARGPVFNALSGLPALPSPVKFALIGGLLYLGMKKKIPMVAAGAGAVGVWMLFPDAAAAAPVTVDVSKDIGTIPPPDFTNLQMPVMPAFAP